MSIRRRIADKQHRWLSQVDLSGVVLSEPVLAEAAPAGFRNLEKRELAQFYKAREIWNLPPGMVEGDPEAQWIDFVFEQLLRLGQARWQVGASIETRFVVALSQQRETLRPTRVLLDGTEPVLILVRIPRSQSLDAPWDTGGSWKASPTTKLERLLRESGVEIGLVTNGEAWRLVVASPSETAAWLTWTTQIWAESPSTLSAFVDLLGEARFFAGPKNGTILELVRASRERQADVAEQLGTQVREALELFVREIDRIDASVDGILLGPYSQDEIFEAAASLLMRLVFLLKAEESALLPHGSVPYDRSYGILHLLTRLERAHRLDPEKLRHSSEGYGQLLGTFRLVHDGSPDPDINIAAYGGELFNADKYPVLEGRSPDGLWLSDRRLRPLPVRDSVLREMLRRLKYARGDNGAIQWISYRTLEIEQLGHMYEGLLDLQLRRGPTESSLLLLTPTDKVPSPVIEMADLLGNPPKAACSALAKATGRPVTEVRNVVERALQRSDVNKWSLPEGLPAELNYAARFIRAAGVVRPGGLYVDLGNRRRDQGAVYTPTTITEPMVRSALEPLLFVEADGCRRVRSAREILSLRICDPAMGSAAFLVQVVRFLSERLVDAWDHASAEKAEGALLTMPYGLVTERDQSELLMPDSREERVMWARRFVAERCVYGVDINPLAVEMAKLSLWLATAAPTKPFTFLDHVLRCGNAVVGADLEQLQAWSLDRSGSRHPLFTLLVADTVGKAVESRHELARMTGRGSEAEKRLALRRAETATARLVTAADLLVASWLAAGDDRARENNATEALVQIIAARTESDWGGLAQDARKKLNNFQPFHWPCHFPEVFVEGKGFDAVIGNPPYVRQELFVSLKPYLKRSFVTFDGSADLYVYFCELGWRLLRPGGRLSFVVNNKWLKAGYGVPLRKFFAGNAWVESVVDFGHAKQLFKNVDVFPCIIVLTHPVHSTQAPVTTRVCVIGRTQVRLDDLLGQLSAEGYDVARGAFGGNAWTLDPPKVRDVMAKMVRESTTLADYAGTSPLYGVKTGYNDAFFVNDETRSRLIHEDPSSADLLKPMIRGRDIRRWVVEPSDTWLIFARRGIDIEQYPAIRTHLENFRNRLEPKPRGWKGEWGGRKAGTYKWFELQDPVNYWQEFAKPKIILHRYMYHSSFAIADAGMFLNDAAAFLPTDDPWLVAVLNSPAFWWYAFRVFPHKKDETVAMDQAIISAAPIAPPSTAQRDSCRALVAEITRERRERLRVRRDIQEEFVLRLGPLAGPLVAAAALKAGAKGLREATKKALGRDSSSAVRSLNSLAATVDGLLESEASRSDRVVVAERALAALVFDAYKLDEAEIELVWATAPPRTPLAVDEEASDADLDGDPSAETSETPELS